MVFLKGVVAYDSVHGSTRTVAEAIAEQIRSEGHEAQLVFIREPVNAPLEGDILFIGSPTRGGVMTKAAKAFIGLLDGEYWKVRKVITFDTLGPISRDPEKRRRALSSLNDRSKTAANKMKEILENRGIPVHRTMHFAVMGLWGPAAPDAPETAKEETHQLLAELS